MLVAAELEVMRTGNNSNVCLLKAKVNVLIDRESRMWSQRARVLWLSKETKIQKVSIVKPQRDFGKILS